MCLLVHLLSGTEAGAAFPVAPQTDSCVRKKSTYSRLYNDRSLLSTVLNISRYRSANSGHDIHSTSRKGTNTGARDPNSRRKHCRETSFCALSLDFVCIVFQDPRLA